MMLCQTKPMAKHKGQYLRCAASLEISRTANTLHFSGFARLDLDLCVLPSDAAHH
jgi:hypothetical protein